MPLFESLEMKPGELPPAVVPRATVARWFPALTLGQTAAVSLIAVVWLGAGLLPLEPGPVWARLGAGRALAAHMLSSGFLSGVSAAQSVGPGWLADLGLYGVWALGGNDGLVLLQTTALALAALALLAALRSGGASWGLAAGLTAFGVGGATLAWPAGAARLGIAALSTQALLLSAADKRSATRWLLPPFFLLWANLDASFLLGLTWLAAWTLGHGIDRWRGAEDPGASELPWPSGSIDPTPARRLRVRSRVWADTALLALSLLACIVQPLGLQGVAAAWQRLGDLARPMSMSSPAGWWFAAALLATAVLLRLSPRRVSAAAALTVGLAAVAALANAAWLPLLAIAGAWATAPHWRALLVAPGETEASATKTGIALAAVFLALMWAPPSRHLLGAPARPVGQIMAQGTPLALAAEIEERQLAGPALFSPGWADYLSWRSGGRLLPLVNDLVPRNQGVWRDALAIGAANHGWLEIADHYQLRYLIVSRRESPELAGAVQREKRCRVLYQDQQGLLVELLPLAKPTKSAAHP